MMYDYAIIGGGIVGLATAMALQVQDPGSRLILVEKDDRLARHQTGHNSGVIHSGIYYTPGSLKSRLCREGTVATKQFCRENDIAFQNCGKLIVATDKMALTRMTALLTRAAESDIDVEVLDQAALRAAEPAIAGLGALRVPAAGIVDYRAICAAMASRIQKRGGDIRLGVSVTGLQERARHVRIETDGSTILARRMIACAGLQSDRLARMSGLEITHRIIPFRGEYYRLPAARNALVSAMIYPVPDPALPFLGIHLTPTIGGELTVGPNAVLSLSREDYESHRGRFGDMVDMATFPGFWRVAGSHWRSGLAELANSVSRRRYLAECRKYCPELQLSDLKIRSAGIRAQAVMHDGSFVEDFLFLESERMLHVCNAPSPAATSAIPIGRMIVDRMFRKSSAPSPDKTEGLPA